MSFILTNHKVLNYPEYDYTMPVVHSDHFPNGDCSFRATLRVLIPKSNYFSSMFRLHYRERRVTTQEYEQPGPGGVANLIASELRTGEQIHLTILNITGRKARQVINAANDFRDVLPERKRLEDVELYLRQNHISARVLQDTADSGRHTFILASALSQESLHIIQSLTPRLIPWAFPNGPDAEQRALLDTLRENNETNYLKSLDALCERFDLRKSSIEMHLTGFEKHSDQSLLVKGVEKQKDILVRMNDYRHSIESLIRENHSCTLEIAALREKLDSDDYSSEMKDYFLRNKSLYAISASGNTLKYAVLDAIEYFDSDLFERYYDNQRSYFFTAEGSEYWTPARRRALLAALFGTGRSLKIQVCAAFTIRLNGAYETSGISSGEYPWTNGHLPHPHIVHYKCLGSHAGLIMDYLCNYDYVGAIEQTVAAVRNLNFGDGTVGAHLMSKLFRSSSAAFIKLPDGRIVSSKTAHEFLDRENNKEVG